MNRVEHYYKGQLRRYACFDTRAEAIAYVNAYNEMCINYNRAVLAY